MLSAKHGGMDRIRAPYACSLIFSFLSGLMEHRYLKSLAAAALLLAAPAASAATITVTTADDELNSDGDCSLREAVQAANTNAAVDACAAGDADGDVIAFADAFTIQLSMGELLLSDDVSIEGSAADLVVVDAGGTSRIFDVDAAGGAGSATAVAFSNLVLQNGDSRQNSSAPDAGGGVDLKSGSAATFTNVDFLGNTAGINGGGLHGAGNTTIVVRGVAGESEFVGNDAQGAEAGMGGGGLWTAGDATITGMVSFTGNTASGTSGSGGGAFISGGAMSISQASFDQNQAQRAGGGIEVNGGTLTLEQVDFVQNTTGPNPGNGGALHVTTGTVTATAGEVRQNTAASEGGGFWNNADFTMTVNGTVFRSNVASGDAADNGGGGLFNNGGTLVVNDAVVEANVATGTSGSGGGLMSVGGSMTVSGGSVVANQANRAGAGVESAGATTVLDGVTVANNVIPAETAMPGNGGGVHAGGGALTVMGGQYTNNAATEGGAIWANGTLAIMGNGSGGATITSNTGRGDDATNGGGGVYVETGGDAALTNATLTDNAATGAAGSGGGLFVATDATATVTGGTISQNRANRAGGGIEVAGGTLTLAGVAVNANVIPAETAAPGNGGGLHAGGGSVMVMGGVFDANEATEGGGLWTSGTLTVAPSDSDGTSTMITNNTGRGDDATNGGGGVYAESGASVTLTGATLSGNLASGAAGSGGGLFVADGSSATVTGALMSQNRANRAGGGIEVADAPATDNVTSLSLQMTTVVGNEIDEPMPGNGGGLHAGGAAAVMVDQSTFSNNAAREGAGLWIAGPSTLLLDRSTVSTNAATEDGGGVYDDGGAEITLRDATVALNTAGGNGGGLLSQSEAFSFANTVLAYNMADGMGADCSGLFATEVAFVQDASGCDLEGDPMTGMDPMLGPLADNGGPTLTHLPGPTSPLLDAGSSPFDVDQRGLPRVVRQADIGSVEAGGGLAAEDPVAVARAWALLPAAPNPSTTAATLRFTTAEAVPVRIELFNVLGQRVQTAFDGVGTPGTEQSVALEVSRLPAGLYVARMTGAEQALTQRITVVR